MVKKRKPFFSSPCYTIPHSLMYYQRAMCGTQRVSKKIAAIFPPVQQNADMRHSQGHNSQQQYSKKKKRLSGKRRKAKKSFLFFTMFENGPKSLIFLKRSVFKYFLSNRLFLDENGSSQTGNKSAVITQPLQLFDCNHAFSGF